MPILWRNSRSLRVTITPPSGPAIVVENLRGNDGYEVDFGVLRTMDARDGSIDLRIYNLPKDLRGDLEGAQVRAPGDLDQILATLGVEPGWGIANSGPSSPGAAGLPTVKLEAGYDGALSELFEAVGVRVHSERQDDTTYVTEIKAIDAIDATLYSAPQVVFERGTNTYDVITFLRQVCGLASGNFTEAQFTGLVGVSKLDAPFIVESGSIEGLSKLLDFLPLRWWIDRRELWIVAKEGQPYPPGAPPAYVPEVMVLTQPIIEIPARMDGGFVGVKLLLDPAALPGRLLVLTAASVGLPIDATPQEIQLADVPPGVYRIEEVEHSGGTGQGAGYETRLKLKAMGLEV